MSRGSRACAGLPTPTGVRRACVGLLAATLLSGCGGVTVKPEAVLPKPLIVPLPATVGLIIPADTRRAPDPLPVLFLGHLDQLACDR